MNIRGQWDTQCSKQCGWNTCTPFHSSFTSVLMHNIYHRCIRRRITLLESVTWNSWDDCTYPALRVPPQPNDLHVHPNPSTVRHPTASGSPTITQHEHYNAFPLHSPFERNTCLQRLSSAGSTYVCARKLNSTMSVLSPRRNGSSVHDISRVFCKPKVYNALSNVRLCIIQMHTVHTRTPCLTNSIFGLQSRFSN